MASLVIIEEQQATRHVMTRYCEAMGLQVVTIATASEAPYLLATYAHPCIVLVAIHAPGLAGVGLLHLLAQGKPALRRHHVIAISDVPASDLPALPQTRATHMLVKPLDFAHLREAIHADMGAIAATAGEEC